MLHGSVDDGDQRYVGHIADIIVDQELEVGNVDYCEVPKGVHIYDVEI